MRWAPSDLPRSRSWVFRKKGMLKYLRRFLQGGLSKMAEAKCTVIGGHSVRNEDVLFGYAVTGLINPKRVWKNVGARTGRRASIY